MPENLSHGVRLMEVLDKGKAAAVTTITETREKKSGKVIFENQSTLFIRGSGGFGGKRVGKGVFPLLNNGWHSCLTSCL
jgi:multifunctional beta-oxidation protein